MNIEFSKEELKNMINNSFFYYIIVLLVGGLGYLIYYTSTQPRPNAKYRYVVTLDNRSSWESNIYCDSFNNKTDTTIVVYIDGRAVNLKAKYDIMIEHSSIYEPIKK
jgi:hypothetical protein